MSERAARGPFWDAACKGEEEDDDVLVPPGHHRTADIKRPKLDRFTGFIDQWLQDAPNCPRKQRHTDKRIFERLCDEHQFQGGYVDRVVIGCGGDVIAATAGAGSGRIWSLIPFTIFRGLGKKNGALDQAAPVIEWELPEEFATMRRVMEARMIKLGWRAYVHALGASPPTGRRAT